MSHPVPAAASVAPGPVHLDPGRPCDVVLEDGTVAVLRGVTVSDHAAVLALHEGVSAASHRFRFFTSSRTTGREYVDHLFPARAPRGRVDADHPIAVLALLALVEGRVVALATAEALDHRTCEVAFLVSDDLQGHGVGTLLLQHLAAAARSVGITRFTAEVLSDNVAMLRVFRSAGFDSTRETTAGVTRVRMSTEASGRVAADVHERCSGGPR